MLAALTLPACLASWSGLHEDARSGRPDGSQQSLQVGVVVDVDDRFDRGGDGPRGREVLEVAEAFHRFERQDQSALPRGMRSLWIGPSAIRRWASTAPPRCAMPCTSDCFTCQSQPGRRPGDNRRHREHSLSSNSGQDDVELHERSLRARFATSMHSRSAITTDTPGWSSSFLMVAIRSASPLRLARST